MLLSQVFKTSEGAAKRARFETYHSKSHVYGVVRLLDGKPDAGEWSRDNFERYTYRLSKTRRQLQRAS